MSLRERLILWLCRLLRVSFTRRIPAHGEGPPWLYVRLPLEPSHRPPPLRLVVRRVDREREEEA